MTAEREIQLENLIEKKIPCDIAESKHFNKFEKEARYVGNGIYSWGSIQSSDARELFLLGICARLGIIVPDE